MQLFWQRLREFSAVAWSLGETPASKAALWWALSKNLRVRLGLARHQAGRVYPLDTRYGRYYFRDNFGDITNLAPIFHQHVYPVTSLDQPGVILDVGANIGLAAAWFLFHNPGREIFCFEPLPQNAAMIRRNCPPATVIAAAAGAGQGQVTLQVDEWAVMASQVDRPLQTQALTFPQTSVDITRRDAQLERVALLKIDVEGMEESVLDGAGETLALTNEVLIETHGASRHQAVIERLQALGFLVQNLRQNGSTGIVRAWR